jgi:glycine/D-amino acid oxidase-like deaminating enzyme
MDSPMLSSVVLRIMASSSTALILGGGVFGLTSALELRSRGWQVTLLDAGSIPHPDAASTDINKVIRMDYGTDEQYTAMGELSIQRWREWNARWGVELFHEDGFLIMTRGEMPPGSFEHDSHAFLTARGHQLMRMDSTLLQQKHPQWKAESFPNGYLNPCGGWGESGRVVARLKQDALAAGVVIREHVPFGQWIEERGRINGVKDTLGNEWHADVTVSALGAWTTEHLPWLSDRLWATAQPVFHFRPTNPDEWRAPAFPVWAADIGTTGWYGFPANAEGIVKVANHGPGRRVRASEPRVMPAGEEARFRAFLRETFPALADAPLASTRICLYGDSFDGHFLIDHDPDHPGLVIASGDSGHAFKFTPVLGELIADAVENKPNPWLKRFLWRDDCSNLAKEIARACS